MTTSAISPAPVGTQIVVAVTVGLLIAFAVQFWLTNLGLALGISLLRYKPQASSRQTAESSLPSNKDSETSLNFSFLAGLGILLTLNTVLFIACFLAVRFSTANDPISGATLGIVIWSTYFLILIYASYNAVGSVTSWLFGSISVKLRQLIKAINNSISETAEPAAEFLTESETTDLIDREIKAALGQFNLQRHIDNYCQTVSSSELDLATITQGFADLLKKLDLESFAKANSQPQIDRQTFIALLNEQTNFPSSIIEQVVDRLEGIWQQTLTRNSQQDLNERLCQVIQSANLQLQSEESVKSWEKLESNSTNKPPDNLCVDFEENSPTDETDSLVHLKTSDVSSESSSDPGNNTSARETDPIDWIAIKNALLNRVDLSEVELEDVWQRLQTLYHQTDLSESGLKLNFNPAFNTINDDIEDYLWHTPSWYLNCSQGWQEFKEVLYDPAADPTQVRWQLERVQPQNWQKLLQQRDDLDESAIDEIVKHLEEVKQEVLALIDQKELSEQMQQLSQLVKNYLQEAEPIELENDLSSKLEQLLIKSGVTTEVLTQFLEHWRQLNWHLWLQERQDLEPNKLEQTVEKLVKLREPLLNQIEDWQLQVSATAEELQHKLESYLRYTNLDLLTPDKIDTKLEQLHQDMIAKLPQIQQLPDLDFSAAAEIVKHRKGVNAEQVELITTQITTYWKKLTDSRNSESQLQTKTRSLSENLVDYLYQTVEQNLSQTEIEADLNPLLNLAQGKTKTLVNQQLAHLNWNEIETKLEQVQQHSNRQIKQRIKQVKEATRKLVKMPKRWAKRTSRQAKNLVDELEDFVRYGNKVEFDSEHLKRNLNRIFHPAELYSHQDSGVSNLERLQQLTPAKITESLTNREDLTPAEAAEISDRFSKVKEQKLAEIQTQQEQANQQTQDLLEKLGEYFNSLNLSHFSSEQLKDSLANLDWQSLTDSWQQAIAEIPLEELGARLEQLSQETWSKIVQTNKLSDDSAWSQIQGMQDYLAQQIETTKQKAYERTESIKQQSLLKAEATRKAIATAVYWIFAISFTSALASALAGFLATKVLV